MFHPKTIKFLKSPSNSKTIFGSGCKLLISSLTSVNSKSTIPPYRSSSHLVSLLDWSRWSCSSSCSLLSGCFLWFKRKCCFPNEFSLFSLPQYRLSVLFVLREGLAYLFWNDRREYYKQWRRRKAFRRSHLMLTR